MNNTLVTTSNTRRNFLRGCTSLVGSSALMAAGNWFGSPAYATGVRTKPFRGTTAQATPPTAEELVAAIQEELQAIDTQIQNHPYLTALQKGRVSIEALKAFPGHEYHTVRSDLRSMAQLVQRFGHHPVAGPFFNGVLQGEIAGLEALVQMAAKLEMSQKDLEEYEVTPEGFTYPTYMAWEALYGSAAAVACGLFVNFAAWGHNCGVMSAALQEKYDFSEEETVFLDSFANLPSFEEVALAIVQDGLDQGVTPAEISRSARLFQAYEKLFWDAMATSANIK